MSVGHLTVVLNKQTNKQWNVAASSQQRRNIMGAPAIVSEQQIINAGLELEKQGARVSEYKIRIMLGDRGRPERIRRIWDDYVLSQGINSNATQDKPEVDVPSEVQTSMSSIIDQLTTQLTQLVTQGYQIAHQTSEKRVNSTIEFYNQKLEEFDSLTKEANSAIEDGDKRIEKLETRVEAYKANQRELENKNAQLKGQLAALSEQSKTEASIERLFSELSQKHIELEHRLRTIEPP
jgi:colicin import membrane protein